MMVTSKMILRLRVRKGPTSRPMLKLRDLTMHKREEEKKRRKKKTTTLMTNSSMKTLQRIQAARIRSKSSSKSMPPRKKMPKILMMKKLRFQKISLWRFFKKYFIKIIAEPPSLMNKQRVGTSLRHMKTLTKKMIKMMMSTKVTKMTMKNNIVKIEKDQWKLSNVCLLIEKYSPID